MPSMDDRKKVELINTISMKNRRNEEAKTWHELIPIEATIPKENQIKFKVSDSTNSQTNNIFVNS